MSLKKFKGSWIESKLRKNADPRCGTGFTLIELLIVIAILAALSVAVVLVLNPAELIKQARDTTRISDLAALNSAVSLYLADVATPALGSTSYCTSGTAGKSTTTATCSMRSTTTVDGTGWVTINLNALTGGSPLARLPSDPNNGSTNCGTGGQACFYQYIPNNTSSTFEVSGAMESIKYSQGGASDVESKDGGDNNQAYETGNAPGLNL